MGVFSENAIIGASAAGGYDIDQSMYIGDAPDSSPKLSRTFNQAGSTSPKWTFATWYKKGRPTTSAKTLYYFEPSSVGASATVEFSFQNDTAVAGAGLRWKASATPWDWDTDGGMSLRDYGAWYHICHVIDYSTSPYVFLYINGVLQDPSTIYGTKNGAGYGTNYAPVSGDLFRIGSNNSNQLGNGYLADTYWIEQQALNPVGTFGEFNEDTGQFVPIEYTGTFSGNSFFLNYSDSSDFGTDSSGLGNDFTATNLVATDQVLDSPTRNYCTYNPLASNATSISEGNLKAVGDTAGSYAQGPYGTFGVSSGKWYWETYINNITGGGVWVGISPSSLAITQAGDLYAVLNSYTWRNNQIKYQGTDGGSTATGYGATYTNGDIIGVALDMDGGTITFYKNNSTQGEAFSSISGTYSPISCGYSSATFTANFGQDSSFAGAKTAQGNGGTGEDFFYTPPTGYKALNTGNLPDPAIALPGDHFNTLLYTGNGVDDRVLTGVGFAPDLLWAKNRNNSGTYHFLMDRVRTVGYNLYSNATDAEALNATILKTLESDGFKVGTGDLNTNTKNIVAWNWKAGGSAVSNSDGSITSSVSANTTAGFSIVSYTGHGATTGTVGHGLGVKPDLIITKYRSGAASWSVYNSPQGATKVIWLDDTSAEATGITYWRDTEPTASVFSVGASGTTGGNANPYIAYCFHSVEGYSKVGSYEGNGNADGSFIYLGFKPEFFLIKNIDAVEGWEVWDGTRETYNKLSKKISPNTTDAEYTGNTTTYAIDFLSNGVKLRTTYSAVNAANTFLYYAVASSPFKTSNAR